MYVYTSVGDELFSDVYPMKVVHDCLYEVDGKVTAVDVLCVPCSLSASSNILGTGCPIHLVQDAPPT